MDPVFKAHTEALPALLDRLLAMPPATCSTLPKGMPTHGIYLFTESGNSLYVGRSNQIPKRVRNHWRPGATHRQAAFAIKLARHATGKLKATYKTEGSIPHLMTDPAFGAEFTAAKARIAAMQVRFVEEADPVRQCLLEVYAAIALRTPYNNFDNH
jgi:hypothetical protein